MDEASMFGVLVLQVLVLRSMRQRGNLSPRFAVVAYGGIGLLLVVMLAFKIMDLVNGQ